MILIVDDDIAIRHSLGLMLKRARYDVKAVASPGEAMEIVRATTPQLILMDMNFSLTTSGDDGIELLQKVKIFCPDTPVILITAWGSIDLAVRGMRAGAFDFVTKPWNNVVLMQRIETALSLSHSKETVNIQQKEGGFDRSLIIGRSKAVSDVLSTIERIAKTNASVLITGESGTGKELIAETIHRNSRRAKNSFVKVNLGGISHTLFESEMFGHKKGAFTDASSDRVGRFELADKGTIFLDELGELDLTCQVKLLRVLQEQTFEVLGESRPRKVDIRVVCATNADLTKMVAERTFREDLYYRINLITLHLPPLRERREDIPLLVRHFASLATENNNLQKIDVADEAMEYLMRQPFPGNVRELKNLVERAILMSGKSLLTTEDFRLANDILPTQPKNVATTAMTLDEAERARIIEAMEKYDGNMTQVAASLGISRQALYRRLEKFGLK